MPLLEIDRLCVSFRRYRGVFARESVAALRDVSLSVDRGECVAMIGASGAGKSVLTDAILGLSPPNATRSGAIRFAGETQDEGGAARWRGARIGLVPQSTAALDPLATIGAQLRWAQRDRGEDEPVAARLARVGLAPGAARLYPHELSGGMARRALFALATCGAPDLLLADEPTSGLDDLKGRVLLDLLRGYADRGAAVLVISHDLVATLRIADRVVILRDGAVAGRERRCAFAGDGRDLTSAAARALWSARPRPRMAWDAVA